jgi:hypothetical protein
VSARAKRHQLLQGAELLTLDPADIFVPERIGFYHPDKAAALGRLMAVDGQRDPIKVTRRLPKKSVADVKAAGEQPWQLVVGRHRHAGAEIEGIMVFGLQVEGTPEGLADLEASENLHRRPLGPLERAAFTAALATAAQERVARENGDLSQHQLAIKARWDRVKHGEEGADQALQQETDDTADTMSAVYGWQESVADALGLDQRTIRRDLTLYRLIIQPFPDLAEALAKHPVVGENGAQLKALTQLKHEGVRRRVIEALLANTEIGVEDAKIAAGADEFSAKVEPVAHMKFVFAVENNWKRLTITQQREQLPRIAAMLKPEMKRELRDQLIAEIGLPRSPNDFEEGTIAWSLAKEGKL